MVRKKQIPWSKDKTKEQYPQLSRKGCGCGYQKYHTPWNKGKKGVQSSWCKGMTKETNKSLARSSEKMLKNWECVEFAKKVLHRRSPSKPEQAFIDLCQGKSLPYRFVGNGELLIGRKNPDFVSTENDHKLIEIWGEFYKKRRNPQDLIDFYRSRGYDCIVIYASELECLDTVMLRVQNFL